MLGDLAYRIGTLVGTGVGAVERGLPEATADPSNPSEPSDAVNPSDAPSPSDGSKPLGPLPGGDAADGAELVNAILGGVAAWTVKKVLRPRPVSWPRAVVAGIGATVMADAVGRALGPTSPARERAYAEDPDALLVRIGSGVATAMGYAALLYPRIPGSPLTRGLVFGAMKVAAAPHGGLVRVATETPGLKFPLKDLAVPTDDDTDPLPNLAFGLALGILYRPPDHG